MPSVPISPSSSDRPLVRLRTGRRFGLLTAVVATLSITALAADSNVNAAKSSVVATFKQSGVSVDAPFTRFSGVIHYDPKNVSASTAAIEVETGSMDIGDEAYNAEVRKKPWLDSATHPKATFRSTAVAAEGPGKFTATGNLTLKGRVLSLKVPITVVTSATGNAFDGTLTISRNAFGIGDATWNDVLDDRVKVRFHLVTAP